MERMELNKEKCGWTWSTGFRKPLITCSYGKSDFRSWSFWVECIDRDFCTRWICFKGMRVSQNINQASYCNINHNCEPLTHWDVSEDEEMVLWAWMTVWFSSHNYRENYIRNNFFLHSFAFMHSFYKVSYVHHTENMCTGLKYPFTFFFYFQNFEHWIQISRPKKVKFWPTVRKSGVQISRECWIDL